MDKKGRCSVCKEEFELTEDDLIIYHPDKKTGIACIGMGRMPERASKSLAENHSLTAYGFKPHHSGNEGFEKW